MNVYEAIQKRLKIIFAEFDNVYVSFSGGKDSGVLLNLCIDYIRQHNLNIKLGVFHLDYEAQYQMTTEYVNKTLNENLDIIDIYRCCVPFKVTTCTSMHESYWRPWEESKKDIWVSPVPVEKVRANSYNPNAVAPPEMKLLRKSIYEDGFTQPTVCYYIEEEDVYEIVDGFHRYLILKTDKEIYQREKGMLPVVVIDKDISNRMASTIRHNRARGSHDIDLMTNIVSELTKAGMSDAWIMRNIGMDADELLRLKQLSGLAELFKDREFSNSWEIKDDERKSIT